MTIQHWLDQVFPNEKNANGEIIKWLTPWCYEIRMDWSRYPGEERLATKVYDDRFVNSWIIDSNTNELIAGGIKESREKSRAIDCKNSNKYNITQDIAKAFEVFCDYEYKTAANGQFIKEYIDENGAVWTGRKVIFYNEAINLNNPLYLNYQKNLQSIERTAESSELYTKLFVTPTESSIMTSGYVTIADTHANPTLDDFILNFDYLHSIGSISDYQMQFAKNYEAEIRKINSHLMEKSPIINELIVDINDQKANAAGYDKQIASARDSYTYYEKLKNSDITNTLVIKNKDNPYSTIFVLEGTMYKASLRLEGIVASSIKGYSGKYDEPLFNNSDLIKIKNVEEIVNNTEYNYFILMDEYDFPIAIYSKNVPSDVVLYLDLEYSPKNKYENICANYLNEIDNYEKQKLVAEETIASLESQLDIVQKAYDAKLQEKEELNRKLERIMGPALREGYWTPDRYENISQAYNKECSFNEGIEFTTSLFENEQTSYVDIGNDRIYYPYINISNELKNKWFGHDLNSLILHLQRDFVFSPSTAETVLNEGNYYFLYNSKQYYFTLKNKLTIGESLTIKIVGSNVDLLLNNSTSIELSTFLKDAFNVTQKFENSTITLGDYLLYNNAGFVFSFKHNENNEIIPILLLNNDKLFSEYKKYSRLAYSFQGETAVYVIDTVITDEPEVTYEIYFPRVFLNNDNVLYTSETLVISVNRNEETIQLEKYYDYSILLHEGKPCITLKSTKANPFYNLIDTSVKYNVSYHVSQANEALYLDAKQVAKDNSKPKFSYDISVALISAWEENKLQKMPYIELGQLAYISDPILGVHAATGYVSEITYKLDKPQEDEIKIQNYKTKFEDLFETITASSEAMKNNQVAYDIAAGNFGPNGAISGDVIQTAINNNDFFFNYSTTGVDINPTEGIVLTNKKPYANGVYGQVVLQGGGIFLSDSVTNTGERIWNNGITPKGINASLITSGQINTNVIKVFSGDDMTFQWNSEGIYSYKLGENGRPQPDIYVKYSQQGLHLTDDTLENWDDVDKVNGHQSLVSLDWDGLTLRNNSGQKTLSADLDGNLTIRGTLKSYDYREGESRLLSTGWKIEPTGYAEFNDLFVRGTISASVFEYEETSAVGGRLLVSPTFILKSEHTNKASIQMAADTPLKIIVPIGVSIANNSFVAGGRTWKLNDVVIFNGKFINKNAFPLIKLGKNINDYPVYETKQLHMVISNLNPTNNTITLTSIAMVDGLTQNLFYGADGNIVDANSAIIAMGGMENIAGTGDWHLISFGTDGAKEGILLTAIEPNSGSYIDILGKGKDNLTGSTRVRLGDLSDLATNQELVEALGVTPQGWGLYADNAYLRGAIYATSGKIGSLSINEVENANSGLSISLTSNTAFTMKENSTDLQIGFRLYCGGKEILTRADLPSFIRDNNFTVAYQAKTNGTWRLFTYFNPAKNLFDDNGNIINTTYKFTNLPTDEAYRVCIFETINNETSEIYSDIQKYTLITDGVDGKPGEPGQPGEPGEPGKPGQPGQNAVQYKIIPSATSIVRDLGGSITPELIRFSISKIDGATTETTISTAPFTLTVELSCDNIVATLTPTKTERYFTQLLLSYANEDCSSLTAYLKDTNTNKTLDVLTIPFELGDKLRELGTIKNGEVIVADGKVTANAIVAGAITAAKIETGAITTGALTNVGELYLMTLGNGSLSHPSITASEYWSNGVFDALKYDTDIHNNNVYNYGLNTTTGIRLSSEGIDMKGSKLTIDMENFKITDKGKVTVKGAIEAKEGNIANWIIGTDKLYSGEGTTHVELSSSSAETQPYAIWAGASDASSAPFSIKKDGALKSTSGEIGGWTINTNTLTIGTAENNYIGIGNNGNYRIWVGNSVPDKAKFSVQQDGTLKAVKGTIGGWTIDTDKLYAGSEGNYVALNTSTTSNSEYALWAGDSSPSDADFAVKKDGTVYLKKLIALGEPDKNGNSVETEVNLQSYPFWKLWNHTIRSWDTSNNTLIINTTGGTITFKKAAVDDIILEYRDTPGYVYATAVDETGNILYTKDPAPDGGAFNAGLKEADPYVSFSNGYATPYTSYAGVTQTTGTRVSIPISLWALSGSGTNITIRGSTESYAANAKTLSGSLDIINSGTTRVAKVTIGNVQVAQKSLDEVYNAGAQSAVKEKVTVSFSPDGNQSLTVGQSTNFTATVSYDGTQIDNKTITISAPTDNNEYYKAGVTDGENKFEAGTYYRGNGGTKTAVGTSVTPRARILYDAPNSGASLVVVYDVGTSEILYKKGDTFVARGSAITAYTKKT